MDYPDVDNNGIPDAFENRPTITEILNGSDSVPSLALNPKTVRAVIDASADYRFFVPGKGVILLEVFGTSETGACVFRSTEEIREFIDKLTSATQEAFPRPVITK